MPRVAGGEIPGGEHGQYEINWDGYRLAIHVELNGIRMHTRGGYNWTDRFAGIAAAVRNFSPRKLILDGEAVVLDEHGRSDFSRLQKGLAAAVANAMRKRPSFTRSIFFYTSMAMTSPAWDSASAENCCGT